MGIRGLVGWFLLGLVLTHWLVLSQLDRMLSAFVSLEHGFHVVGDFRLVGHLLLYRVLDWHVKLVDVFVQALLFVVCHSCEVIVHVLVVGRLNFLVNVVDELPKPVQEYNARGCPPAHAVYPYDDVLGH
jgi:hypothetical protein